MEGGEVDAAIMSFKDVLDRREVVERIKGSWRAVRSVLTKTRYIPDPDGLILRRRHDEVFLGMKLRRHHVVRVARKDCDAVSRGTVPDANRLVI